MTGQKSDSGSSLALHRAGVYQKVFDIVLDDLKVPTRHGTYVKLSNELEKGTPILATASVDYEEMLVHILVLLIVLLHFTNRVRMSGIVGPKGEFPCPICLVPKDEQPNLGRIWPQRTPESTLATIKEASCQKSKKDSKSILKKQSLRLVDVSNIRKSNYTRTYDLTFAEYVSELFL